MSLRRVGRAAAVLAAAAGMAVAPAAWSAQPPGDSVTVPPDSVLYSPINGPVLEEFGFATLDVRSGPDGSNATGTFSFHFGGGFGPTWSGRVTCLSVSGSRAAVGVEGVLASGGQGYPFVGLIFAVDGPPDTLDFRELPSGPPPTACPSPTAPPPGYEVSPFTPVFSSVTVTDSPSKEQCKRGGWAAFGFKNQGQCVASTLRGAA